MLPDLARHLCCPHCTAPLSLDGASLRCGQGHGFDVARQGYVNLLGSRRPPGPGDTAAMLDRRASFLAGGHYRPILEGLDRAIGLGRAVGGEGPIGGDRPAGRDGLIVEVGAGTGWYLAGVLDRRPGCSGLALDVSRAAAQRAARAHPRAAAIVADAWGPLPVADRAAVGVLSVFSPRNAGEFRRILAPDGVLVVVTPAPDHLAGLVAAVGLVSVDDAKDDRLEGQLGDDFVLVDRAALRWHLELDQATALDLAGMGPSAHHLDDDELARRIAALPLPVEVTAAVQVSAYRPRRAG
jgi:23S rRNA (guanine745-N1)-methyltransferase